MNRNLVCSGIALLLVGAPLVGTLGCGTSNAPPAASNRSQPQQGVPEMATARLQINGFMKSKSGAT